MKLQLFALLVFIVSCSPSNRIARIVEKNPELLVTDTLIEQRIVELKDTIVTPPDTIALVLERIKLDTVYQSETDDMEAWVEFFGIQEDEDVPPVIEKVYIEAQCKEDTIYITEQIPIEIEVPVERIVIKPIPLWKQIMLKLSYIAVPLMILMAILLIRRSKQNNNTQKDEFIEIGDLM